MRTPWIIARLSLVPAIALALASAPLAAQQQPLPQPVIFPLLINRAPFPIPTTATETSLPAVAMDADGDFVVVWQDQSVEAEQIYASLYDESGAFVRGPLAVARDFSTYTGAQHRPDVAMDADGNFVVVWSGGDGEGDGGIFAQRFAADGEYRGENRRVSPPVDGLYNSASVAMDAAGDFAVVWQLSEFEGPSSIDLQRYDSAGAELSEGSTQITSGAVAAPSLAMDRDGDFVVAWLQSNSIRATRFDATSRSYTPVAGGETINEPVPGAGSRGSPAVAMDAAGEFAVVWDDYAADRVLGRRFSSSGQRLNPELVIDAEEASNEPLRAAMVSGNTLAVVWGDEESDQFYVRLGLIRSGSAAPERTSIVNTRGFTGYPDVAGSPVGNLAVGWASTTDISFDPLVRSDDIYARLYRSPAVEAVQPDLITRVSEDGQTDSFTVALRTFPTAPVTVTLTPDHPQLNLGAGDGLPLLLRFDPQSERVLSETVRVRALNDNIAEGPHTVRVRLSAAGPRSGYDTPPLFTVDDVVSDTVTVFVSDNDTATYSVATSTAGTNEGSGTPVTFTIFRGGAIDGSNGIGYRFAGTATFGEDYTISSAPQGVSSADGVIPFAPRQDVQRITISVVDDQIGEPNSSIMLELLAPLPAGSGRVLFPVAVVTLGDNDLAEVRVRQTDGSTRVVRGGASDEISVALRTVPTAPVQVMLTPASNQLDLGAGWGARVTLSFAPNQSAMQAQQVAVRTAGSSSAADLALGASIKFTASSADGGYTTGARFTIDGRDSAELPVEIVVPPGSGPGILSVYLPLIAR